MRFFEYQTTAKRSYSKKVRRPLRGARVLRGSRSIRRATTGAASPTSRRACSSSSRRSSSIFASACTRRPGCPTCASAAASRSTACATRASCARAASSGSSSRPRRATRAARSAPRSSPTASTSATRTAISPTTPTGARSSSRTSSRASPARTASPTVEMQSDAELFDRIARELFDGKIVGWMDGRTEFGPRALGSRSILSAPHTAEQRDRLNKSIKFREEFRPFAPAVPTEHASTYFDLPPGGRCASRASCPVSSPCARSTAPGSPPSRTSTGRRGCRRSIATSPRASTPSSRPTGASRASRSLLNTSFNLAGEPIVNRAVEGYSTFRRCGIDLLVAGRYVVTKDARERATPTPRPARPPNDAAAKRARSAGG